MAGGVPKKFAILKAVGWLSLSVVAFPVVLLGVITKSFILRPGRGSDLVRFMDAAPRDYKPPDTEKLHLATYNIAGLPPIIDAVKDVLPAKERMKEFAEWINRQNPENLPLVIGLQEAFDQEASELFTDEVKERYPYAVTRAGWADIPVLGGSSGLEVHSRVPIKSAAFYPFTDLDGFGVRCSHRGFLRVEVDLGNGKSALIYVTHTQPHADPKHQEIRKNELTLIRNCMENDRKEDLKKGIDREGNYYLMGDLNVANVNDEDMVEINEYNALIAPGEVLASFDDPYLTEHSKEGVRTTGSPRFLKDDVGDKKIEEPLGSFYRGPEQKDRGEGGYGTKNFSKGSHPTVANCRLDYILRLKEESPHVVGVAEIRHILPKKITTTAISDHLLVSALFSKKKE